jgi:hypothetical protein
MRLCRPRATAQDGVRELGEPPEVGSSEPTHLTVEELEDSDVAEIGRDPRADLAPVMPTKLVKPLDLGDEYQLLGGIFERRTLATGLEFSRRKARSDVA